MFAEFLVIGFRVLLERLDDANHFLDRTLDFIERHLLGSGIGRIDRLHVKPQSLELTFDWLVRLGSLFLLAQRQLNGIQLGPQSPHVFRAG